MNEVILPITPSPTDTSQSPTIFTELKVVRHTCPIPEDETLQKFELAPTPAQLGQRRSKVKLSSTEQQQQHQNDLDIAETQLPQDGNEIKIPKTSNEFNFKERFRTLPQFDYDNYKSPTQWPTYSAQWSQSVNNLNEPQTKRYATEANSIKYLSQNDLYEQQQQNDLNSSSTRSLIGKHFFGPDFNVAHFNGKQSVHLFSNLVRIYYYFFLFVYQDARPSETNSQSPNQLTNDSNGKNGRLRTNKTLTSALSSRHLFERRKKVILDLFNNCGIFPQQYEIDDLFVCFENVSYFQKFLKFSPFFNYVADE